MNRRWIEFVAQVAAALSVPVLIALVLLVASVTAALWYWFPAWVPRRLPRLRWRLGWPRLGWPRLDWLTLRWPRLRWSGLRWRWRWPRGWWRRLWWWRRSREPAPVESAELAAEDLPTMPATDLASLADRLAAQGRYAEAVRERLRAMVRELIERGLLAHRPGWTITELAAAAAAVRPPIGPTLAEAARIFSEIWYGQRAATAQDDADMRQFAAQLTALIAWPQPALAGSR
jgi:uncharacterized protein DUF4129